MPKRAAAPVLIVAAALVLGLSSPLHAAQAGAGRPMKVKVAAEQANLREMPDIGSAVLQQIPEGTVLEADRKEGEWYFVRYALEDRSVVGGWIHESLVEVVEEAAPVAVPTRAAERPTQPSRAARPSVRRQVGWRFELSLSGGPAWTAPRDLNDGAQGFADAAAAELGAAASGPTNSLHLSGLVGAELSYRASSWLSVGVAADILRGSNPGRVTFPSATDSPVLETRPEVSVVPLKLSVRFYPGEGFYIRTSGGLYLIEADYLYRLEGPGAWEEWKGSARDRTLGAEVAFGGDWKVGPRTSFFAEAGFRMARASGFSGRDVYRSSAGDLLEQSGSLYHYREVNADSRPSPRLFVREARPEGPGISDARLADINISGTVVRAGFRILF